MRKKIKKKIKKKKKDYKFFPKVSFEIFEKRYKNKNAIKIPFIRNRDFKSREYNKNCKNFTTLFLPRKEAIGDNSIYYDYHIYIPELLCENEVNTYLIDLLQSPSNSEFKTKLGINELSNDSIKIYHLTNDNQFNEFKQFLSTNKEKFKTEKLDVRQYLKKFANKFQITQLHFNVIFIEFTQNQESEYFLNNLGKDEDFED